MALPEDFDLAVELPATFKTAGEGKVIRVVEARVTDEKQVIFLKLVTEEEYLEELGEEE